MKKLMIILTALFLMTVSASAMNYEQARQQALFLTDKMAYELNLSDEQYEAAYEVNLDYLMGINDYNDLYGTYWSQRNLDLSYILYDWQYNNYCAASYFYRPLYWDSGYWHFGIYSRYPHRDYYYFGNRPGFYAEYRGSHSWRMNGGRSWYNGRSWGGRDRGNFVGMRDGYNRGDYGRGSRGVSSFGNRGGYGNYSQNQSGRFGSQRNSGSYGNGNRNRSSYGNGSSYGNNSGNNSSYGNNSGSMTRGNRSFGNGSSSFGRGNNSSTDRQSSTRTTVGRGNNDNNGSSSFGTRRDFSGGSSSSSPSHSFTPSRSTGSSSSSSSSRSFGGSNGGGTRSNGGGSNSGSSNSGGGGHFGGHR